MLSFHMPYSMLNVAVEIAGYVKSCKCLKSMSLESEREEEKKRIGQVQMNYVKSFVWICLNCVCEYI